MSESGDNANNGNNPGAGLACGNNTLDDEVTWAQTSQPLLLDQASLEAIISRVSSRFNLDIFCGSYKTMVTS